MNSRLFAILLALLLCACASRPTGPGAFSFAITGDAPYNDAEETLFLEMMERMDAQPLAFIVHVGDFKSGASKCTDELFERRLRQFNASLHAFIYTLGDNDWTDCRRAGAGNMDPIERLARLRQLFFAERMSLGRRRIETDAQDACLVPPVAGCGCAAHPENRLWSHQGIVFATLNIPGSDNNVGFDRANDEEARCRNEANRQWLRKAVLQAQGPDKRALVVMIQANPWETKKPVYADFLRQVEAAQLLLRKPLLFVHGDTHTYRVDFPFAGVTRLETFGSPFVGWVKVTVDPADAAPFRFEPHRMGLLPALRAP
jgi:hypothetical protein